VTVGLGVDEASLDFGGSSSSLTTKLTGLLGTFAINVDLGTDLKPAGSSLGKFTVGIDTLELSVKNVLKANAEGILVSWDPEKDKDGNGQISSAEQAAYDNQEIVRLNAASIEITKLNLAGALRPYKRRDGTTIPGLVVRNNGFQLGEAELSYTGELNFGSILKLKDIRAGVADFGVTFGSGVNFNGEVFIASGGADLFPGKKFSMSFKDGPDANTEAVRAAADIQGRRSGGLQVQFGPDEHDLWVLCDGVGSGHPDQHGGPG
jgi:hypothetical protein